MSENFAPRVPACQVPFVAQCPRAFQTDIAHARVAGNEVADRIRAVVDKD